MGQFARCVPATSTAAGRSLRGSANDGVARYEGLRCSATKIARRGKPSDGTALRHGPQMAQRGLSTDCAARRRGAGQHGRFGMTKMAQSGNR